MKLSSSIWSTKCAVILCWWLARILWRRQKRRQREKQLDQLIERARVQREKTEFQVLTLSNNHDSDDEGEILPSASETVDRIRNKKFDMLENLVQLSRRCRKYGCSEQVNAITEELYNEAYRQAQDVISSNSKNGNKTTSMLPLLGVPISVKDCIAIQGTYATGGMACRLKCKSTDNSLVVDLLKQSGALPLCKGNTMQVMFSIESHNRIWGRTCNPWDLTRTPGGSSGGDAALVAMGCVPLAVATDLGGSIRIPASFCGVVGFKPTSRRVSTMGIMNARKNDRNGASLNLPSSVGSMARTVHDCALFLKAVSRPEMWQRDLSVPPLLFDEKAYNQSSQLKIGYFETDGWFEPCATAQRGLRETIHKLKAAGHVLIPFEPPTTGEFHQSLMTKLNTAEGNFRMVTEALEGEPMVAEFKAFRVGARMPDFLRWLIRQMVDDRRSHLLGCIQKKGKSVYDYWQLLADILEMQKQWSSSFAVSGIDALIFPAFPLAAVPHGMGSKLITACSYMFIANILQWPSGVVPVTLVRIDEQGYGMDKLPMNQDASAKLANKAMQKSAGLPLSISVMTPQFRDETCLRVMKAVERVTNFNSKASAYLEAIKN